MRRSDQLEDIVQRCLERLAEGATIEQCVREYPAYAAELAPILETAQQLRSWHIPQQSAASRNAVRERARFALETQRAMQSAPRQGWWHHAGRMAWRYAAALVVIFALFGTSVAAAQDDLPGDLLYNVKIGSEQTRVGLEPSPLVRANLLLSFAQRRVDECLALQAAQRSIDGSLIAIQNEYERAWEAIGMVAPDDRGDLIQRYQTNVQSQQSALVTALDSAPSGTTRTTLEDIVQSMRDAQQRIQTLQDAPVPDVTPAPEQSATVTHATPGPDTSASATAAVLGVTTTPTTTTLTQGTPLISTPTTRTPTVGTPRQGIITTTPTSRSSTATPGPRTPTASSRTATPGLRTPTASSRTPTPRRAPTAPRATSTSAATGTTAPSIIRLQPTAVTATPPSEVVPTPRLEMTTEAEQTAVPASEIATTSSE